MKLNLNNEALKCLEEIFQIPNKPCDIPNFCPEISLYNIISTYKERYKESTQLRNALNFFNFIINVEVDGNNCPGDYQICQLKKLNTDDWKQDFRIVTAGLRLGVIVLDIDDLDKLNIVTKE